ncbi:hypothetical protein [Mycolicibacterium hippocampi]|uniref:Uncharacterized protein n=1 Tax=Mycolicibacterium hippocampi TaxID=659824 RepID=A0A850PMT4_9MYCO|nr:hypothetical protein [Mycolicibacterium hippocampi]NVN51619.1 hypothetical protein [Mycolicibacterium hippocampi]
MNTRQIKRKRKLLSNKAAALKELREIGDLTEEQYMSQIAEIQKQRRWLRTVEKYGDDARPSEPSGETPMANGSANLPAVIPKEPETNSGATRVTRYSEEWWSRAKPSVQQHRCKAHRKTGDRCKQPAIAGATVCRVHGGAAKHVKMAARARIENAADRMAKELLGMAIDPDMSPQVKLAAIRDALDRGGLKPTTSVEIGPTKGFEEILGDLEFSTATREESRAARGYIDPADSIGGQSFSELDTTHTAPATAYSPDLSSADDDCDRPTAPQSDQQRPRRQSRPTARPITGEDAMRVAHMVNGLLSPDALIDPDAYGLPPGRSAGR